MAVSKKAMKWIPWVLILPVVLIRGFTTLYPILVTIKNSFFDIKILAGVDEFVGLANYINVFKDAKVQTSVIFTVMFVVVSMFFHILLGVALALILNMKFKGRRFLRTIVLIPWAMPTVVAGMAAKWAFNNDYGLINDFVRRFFSDFQFNWLIHTESARSAVIAVDLWKDLPFFAILVLSGLQFISEFYNKLAQIHQFGRIRQIMDSIRESLCRFVFRHFSDTLGYGTVSQQHKFFHQFVRILSHLEIYA